MEFGEVAFLYNGPVPIGGILVGDVLEHDGSRFLVVQSSATSIHYEGMFGPKSRLALLVRPLASLEIMEDNSHGSGSAST